MIDKKIFTVGITGASGAVYGVHLVQTLLKEGHTVHLILTDAAWQVFHYELHLDTTNRENTLSHLFEDHKHLYIHGQQDFSAPSASGSAKNDGMIIVPCSMGTLAKIANGRSEEHTSELQ